MKARSLWFVAWLGCLPAVPAHAGEIIIIEQAPQGSRSERGAGEAKEKARQHAGKVSAGTTVIINDGGDARAPSQAEQASREAQEYLRGSAPAADAGGEGTTIILRAAPASDAEKARLKARSYVTPAGSRQKECASVASEVGVIGEGPGASKSASVLEKGSSSVNVQICPK